MFDENNFNSPFDDISSDLSDIDSSNSHSSLNYTNTQDSLSLGSEFENNYIEETAIALRLGQEENVFGNQSNSLFSTNLDSLSDVDPGNSLDNALDITLGSTPTTYSDWVGSTDLNDYYRFSLTQNSQVELSLTGLTDNANVELLDSTGNQLLRSDNFGSRDENITAQLLAGTYYIGVNPSYSLYYNTDYDLIVSATVVDEPGNSLEDARDITLGDTATTYSDWVGNTDTNDYYRFSLTQTSEFNLSLTGLAEDADVQLLDSSGDRLMYSSDFGTRDENINAQLLAGTYYIGVNLSYSFYDSTDYDLIVSATAVEEPGNSLDNARDITLGDTATTYSDWVGSTDTNDYYRFSLTQTSEFNLSLTGLSDNADVQIFASSGDRSIYSSDFGTTDENINAQLLAGTYYIGVNPGFIGDNTNYDLMVSATAVDEPGNSLNDALDITLGDTATTYSDWVGSTDSNDYYRFSLTQSSELELSLTGLADNANVQILDSSGNQLLQSSNFSARDENINAQLIAGNYYIGVNPSYSSDNTDYDLTVSATAVDEPGNSLEDALDITLTEESTTYSDWVGATDTHDYYRFSIEDGKNLSLTLTGLTKNADVQLLDSSGALITESDEYGTTSDNIQAQLLSGTYYIRVYSDYHNTDYSLTASAADIPVVPGYSIVDGFGLVDAASAVAQAIGQNNFADVPNLGGNDWGADLINAPEVWSQGYTGEGVVVAVLDTGVDRNHEDLSDNIFTNSGEIAGDGIDNDNNGYIDDFYGWNFDSNNNNTLDVDGHGTHVSGTIAGVNNSFGVTGIAYNAEIMPVKVLGDNGSGSEESVANGIRYAADNGADIINMSLGGPIDDPLMRSAVEYAANKGVIVVIASGNDGDSTTMGNYPAAYATDWGIAVGAVDSNSDLASFTNRSGIFPLTYVTAPGVSVYSTTPNDGYDSYSGTSMATPHVAGVVALMLSANPDLTESEVYDILTSTAESNSADANSLSSQTVFSSDSNALALSSNSMESQVLREYTDPTQDVIADFKVRQSFTERLDREVATQDFDDTSEDTNRSLTSTSEQDSLLSESFQATPIIQPNYDDLEYDELTGLNSFDRLTAFERIESLVSI